LINAGWDHLPTKSIKAFNAQTKYANFYGNASIIFKIRCIFVFLSFQILSNGNLIISNGHKKVYRGADFIFEEDLWPIQFTSMSLGLQAQPT